MVDFVFQGANTMYQNIGGMVGTLFFDGRLDQKDLAGVYDTLVFWIVLKSINKCSGDSGIILCMCPANERRCYSVTSSLIG